VTKPKRGTSAPCGLRAFSCAVIWRDGRPTAVGPNISFGNGINDNDDVVGQFLDGSNAYRAFPSRDGVLSDLNSSCRPGLPSWRPPGRGTRVRVSLPQTPRSYGESGTQSRVR
jgi:hypothetical protein